MKTVIIYEQFIDPIVFIVVDGDYTRLDGVMVNSVDSDRVLQDELCDMLYDPVSGDPTELYKNALKKFPTEEVKNGAAVIVAGFLP